MDITELTPQEIDLLSEPLTMADVIKEYRSLYLVLIRKSDEENKFWLRSGIQAGDVSVFQLSIHQIEIFIVRYLNTEEKPLLEASNVLNLRRQQKLRGLLDEMETSFNQYLTQVRTFLEL